MTTAGNIRVLLSDDHPIVRSGVRDLLSLSERIEVIGEAGNGQEALEKAVTLRPDVLLMDMEMPGLNGVEVARRLAGQGTDVRILALSAYDSIQFINGILELGAYGYLTKEEMPDRIIQAVEGVALGEKGWLSDRIRAKHDAWRETQKQSQTTAARLSKREKQVLTLIAEGLDNPSISEQLFISLGTVKNHVTNIYNKLGLRSRAEAVTWAWENNLVERN
ncbi:response regulator [Acanthopleuribacter pedis]|uniref:Response regulator transcription factor n=1 Tax=Acanthopleuribacter pedis TaxID=442870 RepID=A0A8J7Q6V0_9BACT|nr:response regulator transcription factor [Acanthopleuribacter pedis]MBO1317854.1 response regulator transcription factor [Acanthopleuribacter pedis]